MKTNTKFHINFTFPTDNGGQVFKGASNYPLRGNKGTLWEGGIKAVGFVNSPKINSRARSEKGLMHVTDWFPTLVRLAAGKLEDIKNSLDGYDQWSFIR